MTLTMYLSFKQTSKNIMTMSVMTLDRKDLHVKEQCNWLKRVLEILRNDPV